MEHTAKRIKLSLEPTIEKITIDITKTGHEIYNTDLSLSEQLVRNVDRVWRERGDWKDITEEGLQRELTKCRNNNDTNATVTSPTHSIHDGRNEQRSPQEDDMSNKETAILDQGKLRDSVISKLYFAKCEIDVALDVINILATENKSNEVGTITAGGGDGGGILTGTSSIATGLKSTISGGLTDTNNGIGGNHNLVLPPGTLHATYVSKPNPIEKAQLEQAQLTLGLKRMQQKSAANYLKKSAASLKKLVDHEQSFWDEAVHLRSNHWLMQASSNSSTGEVGISINYGFKDAGSPFTEISQGEMVRSYQGDAENVKQKVQLVLPHNISKRVHVTIKQNQMGLSKSQSESLLGLEAGEETNHTDHYPSTHETKIDTTQRQLVDAQSTVYEAELFSRILSEAQVLPNNIQCEDDCVMVTLDGQIDILIQKIQLYQSQHKETTPAPVQHLISHTIEMTLRLLLIQRHRFNLWKSRTRLMSGQRKTQQLLNSIGDTTSLPGSSTGLPGNTSLISNPITSGVISTGSNITSSNSVSSGGGGSSNTPIISHRTVGSVSAGNGTTPSSSSSSMSRQLTGSGAHHHTSTGEPTSDIPVLAPVISMTRFWILFDRIRKVVHRTVDPLCGETGLGLAVHFKSQHVFNNGPHYFCDAYPYYGEMTSSIAINVFKGSSLQFALNQSGTIIATLPGNVVTLSSVTEFEAFLLREINLICLHMVCNIANDMIRRSSVYKRAKLEERKAYIWQVDEVDEILYGAVKTTVTAEDQPKWKNIHVHLNKTTTKQNYPAYVLQFKERSYMTHPTELSTTINHGEHHSRKHQIAKRFILLSQWQDADMDGTKPLHTFRNMVTTMIQELLE
ncbi:subunit 17 of mediator complex-domain-containing protein [Absidia repens]|uniref:Mediator of RNA polymerase II transcription subunit 17 n=1 Tax=Absidia repens TaxID=90262 RepID=A0A1X2IUZ5_9FUNG|nr:subunit 17 of mediator complex-domain-containing protein [Absidia repens]